MNQLHPREVGSAGHAGTRSGITRQDLMRKGRHLANRHRPKAGGVLSPAAAHLHRRQLEKMVCWTISAMYLKGSQMTVRSTCLATMPYQELAADPRAGVIAPGVGVIAPGDCGHDEAPRSLSQRC
jgi:hypothetical protein